jgi:hypothetical protein
LPALCRGLLNCCKGCTLWYSVTVIVSGSNKSNCQSNTRLRSLTRDNMMNLKMYFSSPRTDRFISCSINCGRNAQSISVGGRHNQRPSRRSVDMWKWTLKK